MWLKMSDGRPDFNKWILVRYTYISHSYLKSKILFIDRIMLKNYDCRFIGEDCFFKSKDEEKYRKKIIEWRYV